MSLTNIFFLLLTIVSLAVFFLFGRYRASEKQLNREDRIDWSNRRYDFLKYFLLILFLAIGIAFLIRTFA